MTASSEDHIAEKMDELQAEINGIKRHMILSAKVISPAGINRYNVYKARLADLETEWKQLSKKLEKIKEER